MLLFQMSLDLVRPHCIHATLVCEHPPFFRMMEILHGTGVIGYGREPRLAARVLRVAFGLWVVGCGLWVMGLGRGLWVAGLGRGLRVWSVDYGFGAWVVGCGFGAWAWVMGYGRGLWDGYRHGSRAWVTDMGMGIGCACMRVAFRFRVRLFYFHILGVMNPRWVAARNSSLSLMPTVTLYLNNNCLPLLVTVLLERWRNLVAVETMRRSIKIHAYPRSAYVIGAGARC
jgi:hypothetical protein